MSSEKNLLQTELPNKTLSWSISYERKIPYLIFTYIPIYEGAKVHRFKYSVVLTFQEVDINAKNNLTNSVLSNGDWYKIKLSNDGLYKIDADFLSDIGVNLSDIDPRNIQIYGNGGSMLPEHNAIYRYHDLVENPIRVMGEEDGSFDQNDFIVFYGESPHRWELNSENYLNHVQNIYDNNNYYFLHIGDSLGKRVVISQTEEVENIEVNFYTEREFYEWENQNLKNTVH